MFELCLLLILFLLHLNCQDLRIYFGTFRKHFPLMWLVMGLGTLLVCLSPDYLYMFSIQPHYSTCNLMPHFCALLSSLTCVC